MTLPVCLKKAEVVYSYKCELCNIREWHIKPSTKFHYNNVNKCSGIWVEEQWHNASFLETARKKLEKIMEDRIIGFEKVSRGQKLNLQIYNTYLMFIRHLKELREEFNAVLGEERK